MFKQYAGIDEAALGPVLGPYCCAAVSFNINKERELFERFNSFTGLQIGDSKKLFTQGKSLAVLELTALSFLYQKTYSIPGNLKELLKALFFDKKHFEDLETIPWFKSLEDYTIPSQSGIEEVEGKSLILNEFLKQNSISLNAIEMDVVPAQRFNHYLSKGLNKSETCLKILTPLVKQTLENETRTTVDRQGGRRYYGEWLLELFPGRPLSIRQETADLSRYDIGKSTIQFQVKGDDKFLETALASIFSKYIRELMMGCFNDYWIKRFPDIKKTAGYPQDGKRFIKDLKKCKADFDESRLIRKK